MGIERHRQGRDPRGIGPRPQPSDQALVAAMHAVEVPDRHKRAPGRAGMSSTFSIVITDIHPARKVRPSQPQVPSRSIP